MFVHPNLQPKRDKISTLSPIIIIVYYVKRQPPNQLQSLCTWCSMIYQTLYCVHALFIKTEVRKLCETRIFCSCAMIYCLLNFLGDNLNLKSQFRILSFKVFIMLSLSPFHSISPHSQTHSKIQSTKGGSPNKVGEGVGGEKRLRS